MDQMEGVESWDTLGTKVAVEDNRTASEHWAMGNHHILSVAAAAGRSCDIAAAAEVGTTEP